MKIAIVGRPNTGKSTLFNKLSHSRDALVHDRPGVTRDVIEGTMPSGDVLYDTAGLENARAGIAKLATDKSLDAIRNADAILFVVDGRAGIVSEDLSWAQVVKRNAGKKSILLVVNKCESRVDLSEFYKLGFGTPHPISAEHKIGLDTITSFIDDMSRDAPQKSDTSNNKLSIAILGQPNVGKSTLVNKILGTDRVIVRDEPGVTRDTVHIHAHALGRDFVLTDTAGLRKKSRVTDDVETLSALKALDAIEQSDVIILIADATGDIEKQVLNIASRVYDAGKILIIALNKWDVVSEELRDAKLLKLKHHFDNSFSQIIKPVLLPISALNGTGVRNMLRRAFTLYDASNVRVPTSKINRIVEKLVAAHQPPMSRLKRAMKIKFATETHTRPIVITINVGGASDIPDSYTRYLRRGIATALGWEALPIRIEYTKSENPFAN